MAIEFDSDLRERLVAFQRSVGLSGDGVAGALTWEKLTETSAEADVKAGVETGVDTGVETGVGETGEAVSSEPQEPMVRAEDYPALASVLAVPRTDEGVKTFLRDDFGLDIDQVLQDMDALLPTAD